MRCFLASKRQDSCTSSASPAGARRTVAFFPDDPSAHDVNISVVITNVSVEFTKLGSFGNIDTFASEFNSKHTMSLCMYSCVCSKRCSRVISDIKAAFPANCTRKICCYVHLG